MAVKGDYVDRAENVIKSLDKNRRGGFYLTTSKIRNILTLVNQIYNEVVLSKEEILNPDIQGRIRHLKVRIVYEAGREVVGRVKPVKDFVEKARIIEEIDRIGDRKDSFIAFSKYMEALVAYHRYYGGND